MVALEVHSPHETKEVAAALARHAVPGDVVTLSGPLGAGKTAFVKGLAVGLGLPPERVTSPTFTLIHEYRGGRLPLFHMDLYRIEQEEAAEALGIEEYLYGEGLSALEWGERIRGQWPPNTLEVTISPLTQDALGRLIVFQPHGPRAVRWLQDAAVGEWRHARAGD